MNLFDYVFSESNIGYLKTNPKYYEKILEHIDSTPTETVSIGDTPLSDIRPAKIVGKRTIWVNRRNEPEPSKKDQKADNKVNNLLEATHLI